MRIYTSNILNSIYVLLFSRLCNESYDDIILVRDILGYALSTKECLSIGLRAIYEQAIKDHVKCILTLYLLL